ncbi:MAG: hypothetical protein WAV28_19900 [Sedimentisphaerales bacterium]|jgi:hypothetical protein
MKKYLISAVAILVVLALAWAAFGQAEERASQRESMRQRFQNMSEQEREQFRAQMRERGGRGGFMSPEEQEKAIKAIEEQLAKLKAAPQIAPPEGGFQNLSEDERANLREKMTKARQERQTILQTIIAQVARLQGRMQPAEEAGQYIILNVGDLKPIQDSAVKEKAKETAQLLERLIARGSGQRGPGGRQPGSGQRPEGGQRGGRGTRTPGGPEGSGGQGNR